MTPMLEVEKLSAWYGAARILYDLDLTVGRGEVVALMGRNGAGKTTTMKTIMALVAARSGTVRFNGADISRLKPFEIARRGLGFTPRPAGAAFMHYECELAVVIGRTAKKVKAADALACVAGYTVCNDYAVRDYLENFYRPNLRVKNRDACTAIGPWLVDAADVPDPHARGLRTRVNGRLTQSGHTGDMIHRIPELIEYLSAFMTLQAGDVILTGTPEGVVDVQPGDQVVCEIDGLGSLHNTIAADTAFGR